MSTKTGRRILKMIGKTHLTGGREGEMKAHRQKEKLERTCRGEAQWFN
ncbi:unnamed protein product [Brassica oleracea]